MRVYDYHCPVCGSIDERFVRDEGETQFCSRVHVGETNLVTMTRLIPAPRANLEGFTGAFPGAADKWVKTREKRMAEERKHKDRHGTEWIGKNA